MAGLIDPNDIAKARQSGYSDTEISSFLADKHPEQFKAAREAGYNDKEILSHLAPTEVEPSGIAAGAAHGVAGVASGLASGLNLAGVKTDGLDAMAATAEPKDYKSAPLIREGGHWYNPADYQPSSILQRLAEAAPGIAADVSAGWAGGKVGGAFAGARGAVLGSIGSALAAHAARTFGPGAHENADARTGVPNSPVTLEDATREVGKQALQAPFNMIPASRFLGGAGKALAGSALAKYAKGAVEGAGVTGIDTVIDQAGTTLGSKEGLKFNGNAIAENALLGGIGSSVLASPRFAADIHGNAKYGTIDSNPDTKAAAVTLAKRYTEAADGRKLVGPLGGTKTSQEVKNSVHSDVHNELSDAAKTEDNLSQGSSNVLDRIQKGGTATPTELKALSDEASPETASLARQALLSAQTKATGGLSGAMEKLGIMNPLKAGMGMGATALGAHAVGMGMFTPAAVAATYGAYGLSRGIDKLTGARSPVQGLTDRYADANVPVRVPEPVPEQPAPVTTSVPQMAPPQNTQLWGAPKPEVPGIDAGAQNADIRGMLLMAAARRKAAEAQQAPEAPPEPTLPWSKPTIGELWNGPNPIARKMLQEKLKQGLPAETPDAPTPPPAPPAIDPNALPTAITRPAKNITRGFKNSARAQEVFNIATRKAEGTAQAEGLAADSPAINEQGGLSALSNPEFTKRGSQLLSAANVMKKLTAQPKEDASAVSDAPASPAISALMQKLNGQSAAPQGGLPPQAPMIAKISKKLNGSVNETPHPEEDQPYTPKDEADLWRKHLSEGLSPEAGDQAVAARALADYQPAAREKYSKTLIENRSGHRNDLESISHENPADGAALEGLYHRLDDISTATEANKAIKHYTAFMSPKAAHAVHARYTHKVIAKRWKN